MPIDTPHTTPHAPPHRTRAQATRDMAAHMWRARAGRVATIWILAALAELAAWRFLLTRLFFREFFMPVAILIPIVALAATWRTVQRRESDRRNGDRRRRTRRSTA